MKSTTRFQVAGSITLGLMLSVPAHAESSVILYGVADSNVEYVNNMSATGSTATPGQAVNRVALMSGGSAGSRWGIRGIEDLGGGLQGVFVAESGFAIDTGNLSFNGRLFGRQAFVGLNSRYGKVTFGRQYSTAMDTIADFQVTGFSPQYEPTVAEIGKYVREDNTVKYTGAFGPLTAEAHWSFGVDSTNTLTAGETPGAFHNGTGWGIGANYYWNKFGVAVAYDNVAPLTVAGGAPAKNQIVVMGLQYSIDKLKVVGGYRWAKFQNPQGAVTQRDNYYWVGGTYQITTAIDMTMGLYYDDQKIALNPLTGAVMTGAKNPWQLLYIARYYFSKRTNLYLTTAYAKNNSLMFDSSINGMSNGYTLGAGKNQQFGAAIGIKHVF